MEQCESLKVTPVGFEPRIIDYRSDAQPCELYLKMQIFI